MASPAHALPGPSRAQRARLVALWVLAADLVLLGASGAWLAFRYEPGAGLSGLHAALGVVAVVAAAVAAVATVVDAERSTVAVVPAVVVLGIVGALYVTGPTLAYETLSVNDPTFDERGVVAVFDDNVGAVGNDGRVIEVTTYRRLAWLHVLALPLALVAIAAAGVWGVRRRRREAGVAPLAGRAGDLSRR